MVRYFVEVVSDDLVRLWQLEPPPEVESSSDPVMLTSPTPETHCCFAELLKLDGKQIEVDFEKKIWRTAP